MASSDFFNSFYIGNRGYAGLLLCAGVFVLVWLFKWPMVTGIFLFLLFMILVAYDLVFLFLLRSTVFCKRELPYRLSNSDYNNITIRLRHNFRSAIHLRIIEELPIQFQERENHFDILHFAPGITKFLEYRVRPVSRGEYEFGHIIAIVTTPIRFLERRMVLAEHRTSKVYPSFLQFRSRNWLNATVKTEETGIARVKKTGVSLEFDHIKEYAIGDDLRKANWSATARKGNLMVNSYVDEKSQQVFSIIDKGRLMKMPFHKLSLVDHAINSTLVLANVALQRRDRFGLMTFSHKAGDFLAADRKPLQLRQIQETLYKTETQFLESDFENLYLQVRKRIKQRSLLLLFTNFESATGMRRQLPYLKMLARHHLIVVIFFENSELVDASNAEAEDLEDIYVATIAERFVHEKKMMRKELQSQGITTLLTQPESLTVDTVNKYLEIKARRLF